MADLAKTIADAIRTTHALRIRYHDKTRVVEPYLLGAYGDTRLFVLAWMVRCDDDPGKRPGWQHYLVSEIQSLKVLSERFDGGRSGYNPVSDNRVQHVVCAVPALKIVE